MKALNTLYGLNDITIIPSTFTEINSRSECNPFYKGGLYKHLPLFTAPMSCVIDDKNYKVFQKNKINTIIPRNINFEKRKSMATNTFVAMGFGEFKTFFESTPTLDKPHYVCIDMANGHMLSIYDLCKKAKEKFGDNIVIMVGNIANPLTYGEICKMRVDKKCVVDYVRCSIGSGFCCTTSANAAIHYPMATLIMECVELRERTRNNMYEDGLVSKSEMHMVHFPKIVADGGFDSFDKIIKALAIGSDYVMLGSIFAKADESCGEVEYRALKECDTKPHIIEFVDDKEMVKYHHYYGMSTRKAQKEFGSDQMKTAEGIERIVSVDYTLPQWTDNFISYLRSAMSYTNVKSIDKFIGTPKIAVITNSAFNAYYK